MDLDNEKPLPKLERPKKHEASPHAEMPKEIKETKEVKEVKKRLSPSRTPPRVNPPTKTKKAKSEKGASPQIANDSHLKALLCAAMSSGINLVAYHLGKNTAQLSEQVAWDTLSLVNHHSYDAVAKATNSVYAYVENVTNDLEHTF